MRLATLEATVVGVLEVVGALEAAGVLETAAHLATTVAVAERLTGPLAKVADQENREVVAMAVVE